MTNELNELKFLNMRLWEHNRQRYVYDVFTESATLFKYDEETSWEEVFYQLKIGDNSRFVGELFTGVLDKKARPVYVGDVIDGTLNSWLTPYKGVVKFGQYKQDGSGDEYPPSICIGFYAELIDPKKVNQFGNRIHHESVETVSLMDLEGVSVIGNVHQHKELLERKENPT